MVKIIGKFGGKFLFTFCLVISFFNIYVAKIEQDGKTYKSNIVYVQVGQKEIFKDKSIQEKKLKEDKKVFFTLSADRKNIFVGEKVNCSLRLYSIEDEEVHIEGVAYPELKDFKRTEGPAPVAGKKEIDGDVYNYAQWKFSVIPTKTGELILPACKAIFKVVQEDPFGGFLSLLGYSYERKQAFSNSLTFNISPLPVYDRTVNAIGNFRDFDASVDRSVAKEGDAIVYTLELEGSGDLDSIDITELKDMPKELKYYDSKRYILDNSAKPGMKKKRFEFIVQGLHKGDVKMPSQTFTFFNPKTKMYKTLKTDAINLKILPVTKRSYVPPKKDKDTKKDIKKADKDIKGIKQIRTYGQWYESRSYKISFWVFILLLLIPVLPFIFVLVKKIYNKLRKRYLPHMVQKHAFAKAVKHLKIAKKKNNLADIYALFITFFAERFELNQSVITQEGIVKILQDNNFSQDDIFAWEEFFTKISQFVFSENKSKSFDKIIFNDALVWLNKFKDIKRKNYEN